MNEQYFCKIKISYSISYQYLIQCENSLQCMNEQYFCKMKIPSQISIYGDSTVTHCVTKPKLIPVPRIFFQNQYQDFFLKTKLPIQKLCFPKTKFFDTDSKTSKSLGIGLGISIETEMSHSKDIRRVDWIGLDRTQKAGPIASYSVNNSI